MWCASGSAQSSSSVAGRRFQPACRGQVSPRSARSRDLAVRDIADQRVGERVFVLAGDGLGRRLDDEPATLHVAQGFGDPGPGLVRGHRGKCARPERISHDGGVLQERALRRGERVESRRDQGVNALRERDRGSVRHDVAIAQHAHELQCVEGVATCALHERALRLGRKDRSHQELAEQLLHIALRPVERA